MAKEAASVSILSRQLLRGAELMGAVFMEWEWTDHFIGLS